MEYTLTTNSNGYEIKCTRFTMKTFYNANDYEFLQHDLILIVQNKVITKLVFENSNELKNKYIIVFRNYDISLKNDFCDYLEKFIINDHQNSDFELNLDFCELMKLLNFKTKKIGVKKQHRWSKDISQVIFKTTYENTMATIVWQKRNEVKIFAGARLLLDVPLNYDGRVGFSQEVGLSLREKYQNYVVDGILIEDLVLRSVNEVGLFLYFGKTNSWMQFKSENGQTIDELT